MRLHFGIISAYLFSATLCIAALFSGFLVAFAAPINPINTTYPNYYAWNDVLGWINFQTGTVDVLSDRLEGYVSFGPTGPGPGAPNYISLDCATGPVGSSCTPVSYKILNDATGNLTGWAWSDAIGWISFSCKNPETGGVSPDYSCTQSLYGVKINSSGDFSGWAWNDLIGWISFNCNQTETGDTCATVNYKVKSAWVPGPAKGDLISGTFDTQSATGVAFNYIAWRGSSNGGRVSFQFAASNCENGATNAPACTVSSGWGGAKTSGDGAFLGPGGTTAAADAYVLSPNTPVKIANQNVHNNRRYYRYKVYVETDNNQTATPIIEDVIINWSP